MKALVWLLLIFVSSVSLVSFSVGMLLLLVVLDQFVTTVSRLVMSVLVCVCVSCANLDCSHVRGFSLSSVIVFFPLFSCFFSSLITGITNSSGVASVTVTGLSSDTLFTCSYGGVSDTVTVTVPASLIQTTLTSVQTDDNIFTPSIGWLVALKDNNSNPLSGKTVKFYVDTALASSQTTLNNGQTGFGGYTTTFGTHTIKAVFEGDNTYEGCEVSRTVTFEDPFGGLL